MLDPKEWAEIEPYIYQRRPFTAEEIKRLLRRPDDLIRSAMENTRK